MHRALLWPRSLKQRLIAQLLALQLAILLAFGLSFVSLLVLADEGGVLVRSAPVEAAFDAIRRGPEGKLVLAKTGGTSMPGTQTFGSSRATITERSCGSATSPRSTGA